MVTAYAACEDFRGGRMFGVRDLSGESMVENRPSRMTGFVGLGRDGIGLQGLAGLGEGQIVLVAE